MGPVVQNHVRSDTTERTRVKCSVLGEKGGLCWFVSDDKKIAYEE